MTPTVRRAAALRRREEEQAGRAATIGAAMSSVTRDHVRLRSRSR